MELGPLEKPPVSQPLKNSITFYGTRRLIARHWFLREAYIIFYFKKGKKW
jgi:hypothetical protein